jgi:MFS family permease
VTERRGYILIVLTALMALNHLDRQLLNILLELVRREFDLTDVQLGLLSGLSFAVVFTTLSIPAAVWAVRHDRGRLISGAALLWGVMTIACGAAQSFWQLLAARIGVGVGEAGGPAPSQAMLSDLYGPGERATAMATLSAGINLGVLLAFLFGGLIGHTFGWRAAFVSAGVLTLLLALLVRFTVRDPPRVPDPDHLTRAPGATLLRETLQTIWSDGVLRQLCLGASLISLVAYSSAAWLPSFVMRSHNLNVAQTGMYLAGALGIGGAIGAYFGGRLSDALRTLDIRWSLWVVGAATLIGKPLAIAFYLLEDTRLALALLVLPAMFSTVFLGPTIAVLHDRVPAHLRPIASAVLTLVITLIGLGIGPVLAGALSQYVFAASGEHSLRYALVLVQLAGLFAVVHYYLAGRWLAPAP